MPCLPLDPRRWSCANLVSWFPPERSLDHLSACVNADDKRPLFAEEEGGTTTTRTRLLMGLVGAVHMRSDAV